jgi:ABC-2 type transport system permease protein
MQSKTSSSDFFNRTLIRKNVKRFWPLWVGYSLIMFWMLTAITYLNLHLSFFGVGRDTLHPNTISDIYRSIIHGALYPAVIFSMLIALAVFAYLGNERSCYYYHSLPMTRSQLFTNGFVSGLGMMFVPNLVLYLLTNIICWSDGLNAIKALSTWLLVITVEELFFFSFAALCMIMFGNNLAAPVIYTILIFYVSGMQILLNDIYHQTFFGASSNLVSIPRGNPIGIISPVMFFNSIIFYRDPKLLEAGVYECYVNQGLWVVMITGLAVSVLLIIAGLLLYKVRKSEHSGDVVAIDFLKPVFRWGFGISFAILITTLIVETLLGSLRFTNKLGVTVFMLLMAFGIIAYIAAEMIIKKSFRVFKGLGRKFALYTGFLAAASCILLFAGSRAVAYIPEQEKIGGINVGVNGYMLYFTDAEDVSKLSGFHHSIVADKEELVRRIRSEYTHSYNITFRYILKNGKQTVRNYSVPLDCEAIQGMDDFMRENAMRILFGDPDTEKYSSAEISQIDGNMNYHFRTFYSEQTKEIVKCLIKDYESGYIPLEVLAPDFLKSYTYSDTPINSHRIEIMRERDNDFDDEELYMNTLYTVYFNDNCVNTVKYLQKYVDYDSLKGFYE